MNTYRDSKGNSVVLLECIADSGEAKIWTTNRQGSLAKIYHSPNSVRRKKLEVMVGNPPKDPSFPNHISIVWPQDLLRDSGGYVGGFLMPHITNSKELLDIYTPINRKVKAPRFNWYCLHIVAKNVASIVQALHVKNYIVCDMKSQNILVNDRAMVSVIDTDSFQITDPQGGTVYRCSVGSEGFNPPELIGKDLSAITQNRFHDRFRLGVLIHYLLFGYHPFMGQWIGTGDPSGLDDSISKGYWPYGLNSQFKPSKNTIPLDVLHPEIKKCFLKCFNEGHTSPRSRPSAEEWVNALEQGISKLDACIKVGNHSYSITYGSCYWCERANHLGVDIFPYVDNPIKPSQLLPLLPKPVPPPPRPVPSPPKSVPPPRSPVRPPALKVVWVKPIIVAILILSIAWQLNAFGFKHKICTEWYHTWIEKVCW